MADPVIEVRHLKKYYGPVKAVDDVGFTVERGEVFGFLGPNGAGKTTTLEVIEGLQEPTAGETYVLGLDSHRQSEKVKERIGVQLQGSAYFDYLTLGEILGLFASFYPRSLPVDDLLLQVGVLEKKHSLVKHLSGGQRQRFSIAASLINDPELVFLDEPTTGLDPQARRHLWETIRGIQSRGKTVVLTTHYMEEAEVLCDRVAVIDLGHVVALDRPKHLIHQLKSGYRIKLTATRPVEPGWFKEIPGVIDARALTDHAHVYELRATQALQGLPTLFSRCQQAGIELEDLEVQPGNLEDVFLELTGKGLRD